MISIIHLLAALLLFTFHSLFLLRSVYLLKRRLSPTRADRLFLNLSQLFLPLVLISGFIMVGRASLYHLIPGIMPVLMLFILSRRSLRKKKPLLLPLLNWIFITAALLTGLLL